MKFRARYVPSHSQRQMNAARARRGLKPSTMQAMDDFLMSEEVQDVALDAAKDIADTAAGLAVGSGSVETGGYARGFEAERTEPVVAGGNPRRAARVSNEYVDENGYAPAAAVEFGNKKAGPGKRVLGRAGEQYHTPRGIA
jgi:sugar phosphate isomerase/epimerase